MQKKIHTGLEKLESE